MNKKLLQLAFKDIISGIKLWRIWLMLGWQDIRLRYRRSQLGPFWITLSMAIMIYSMGFLYGKLLKTDMSVYYPFLGSGLITWALISTIITEANDAFMESQDYIKQINLPYTIYILRVLTRNFIIFFHNIIPLIPIMIYFRVHFGPLQFLFFLLGLIIILLCGLSYGTLLAMIGTRYRDIKQIIFCYRGKLRFLGVINLHPCLILSTKSLNYCVHR